MLYKHQLDIITDDRPIAGLFLGTGSGKTLVALSLARGKTLVIAPKTQKEDQNWERENKKNNLNVDLTVISKETFRRDAHELPRFDTVIVDEAHTCLGVTPSLRWRNKEAIPKTSQLFEELQLFLRRTEPKRLYLATATIMRSPMTVWGAGQLLGHDWNFYEFRSTFYAKLPMPGREVWTPKKTVIVKERLAKLVRSIGYVGRLEEFFDVPDQTYKTMYVDLTPEQKTRIKELSLEYPDPLVLLGKKHQVENGVLTGNEFLEQESYPNGKIDKILELSIEFPKMVVFAKYRAQIDQIATALEKEGKNVLVLTGDTKDRGNVIAQANEATFDKGCIFIAQAQISAGWELPKYPCMVFASRTYSYVDYVQSLGRIQRANNIKKNLYINLVVKGGIDEAVDKALSNKQDFDERIYLNV